MLTVYRVSLLIKIYKVKVSCKLVMYQFCKYCWSTLVFMKNSDPKNEYVIKTLRVGG